MLTLTRYLAHASNSTELLWMKKTVGTKYDAELQGRIKVSKKSWAEPNPFTLILLTTTQQISSRPTFCINKSVMHYI